MTHLEIGLLWLLILAIGAGTYTLRVSFVQLMDRLEIPPRWMRAQRYLPIAVLSALIVPTLLYQEAALDLSLANERLLAGIVAAAVAWRTKNALLTLAIGMITLWGLQAML